jgi:predicted dehydrogenase
VGGGFLLYDFLGLLNIPEPFFPQMTPPKIRWGILSTGSIARRFAGSLKKSATGTLSAVASRSLAPAEAFAAEFGVAKAHGDYASLIADPDIDAVYIAPPHPMHREWALRCAEAGKAILCEKPAGMDRGELVEMLAAAKANGVFFMEAFMYRCHPQTRLLRETLRRDLIGPVRMIHATFSYPAPDYNPKERRYARELGGGSILDVGCYGVSMSRLIAGELSGKRFADPLEVKGFARLEPREKTDLTAAALLRFEGDLIAMVQSGVALKGENIVRIEGEKGTITVGCPWAVRHGESFLQVTGHLSGETTSRITTRPDEDLYAYEIDEVGRAIASGEKESPEMSWEDSLGNAAVLDAWLKEAGVSYD